MPHQWSVLLTPPLTMAADYSRSIKMTWLFMFPARAWANCVYKWLVNCLCWSLIKFWNLKLLVLLVLSLITTSEILVLSCLFVKVTCPGNEVLNKRVLFSLAYYPCYCSYTYFMLLTPLCSTLSGTQSYFLGSVLYFLGMAWQYSFLLNPDLDLYSNKE